MSPPSFCRPDNESNTKDAMDDLQQQTNVVQEEAEEHNNIALDSDKMDKTETSSLDLDADPDPNQAPKPEEESMDAMKELDQDETLDDIKTELVSKMTEEEGTDASADVSELNSELHSDDEKLEETSKGEEKDILKEQLSTEALGEKGDIKTTEDGEDKGKETSTVDQQIDERGENIGDEKVKGKDEEKHKTKGKGDEKEKEKEEKKKETEGEKVEGIKETKEEMVEKERETKDEEDERIKQDQEEKKDVVESDDEEVKPKVDGTEEETKTNVTDTVVIKTEEMPSYDEWREKKLQQAQEDFDRELGRSFFYFLFMKSFSVI